MCRPNNINIDSRTNYLLLKTVEPILPNEAYPESSVSDMTLGGASLEFLDPRQKECSKPSGISSYNNVRLIAKVVIMAMLILGCISNHIQFKTMGQELDILQTEMGKTREILERRRIQRRRRLNQQAKEAAAYRHVLKSFEVPVESELAQEILVAYDEELLLDALR